LRTGSVRIPRYGPVVVDRIVEALEH
jgi:hypothetical protein